ncbi:MAG: hypothetical protein LUC22_01325 [Prevotella sp.]|nr:hypothetical protein [Prevotella sp.]
MDGETIVFGTGRIKASQGSAGLPTQLPGECMTASVLFRADPPQAERDKG